MWIVSLGVIIFLMKNNYLLILKFVWLALFSSIFIYSFISVNIVGDISYSMNMNSEIQIYYFIGVMFFLMAFILSRILLKPIVQKFRSQTYDEDEMFKLYFAPAILKFFF